MKKDIKTKTAYVQEAMQGLAESKAESWRDAEIKDGQQWTQKDWDEAEAAGIDPLTVNKAFPILNLIAGINANNETNIIAKARTQQDAEVSQTMTESIKFVLDQNGGAQVLINAFNTHLATGCDFVHVSSNPDPRKEKIRVKGLPWTEVWWDPYASPWMDTDRCRYVFHMPWMDLDVFMSMFPEKEKEIKEMYEGMAGHMSGLGSIFEEDEGFEIEDRVRMLVGGDWIMADRQRVRPVQMYYTERVPCIFGLFPDGRAVEIKEDMDPMEQFQIMDSCQEVVNATVPKMRVSIFMGDLEIMDERTPYGHDEFPITPFIAYLDRFNQPFGVPRQIRGQQVEVNKRRSMLLAMLKKRKIIVEKSVVDGNDALQNLYSEANKLDGMMVVNDGKMGGLQVIEGSNHLQDQLTVQQLSDREIDDITGVNAQARGRETNITSGVALQKQTEKTTTILTPLLNNAKHSYRRLGELIVSMIQGEWKQEKILRITERVTSAERFITLNERVIDPNTGTYTTRNNITQGKYDIVISEAPQTDTIREQNMNLIIEWMKKIPESLFQQVAPQLMTVAMEMSNLPNKETLMAKLKPILGEDPQDENLSPEEIKQKAIQAMEGQQQEQQKQKQLEDAGAQAALEKLQLENQEIRAKIEEIMSSTQLNKEKAETEDLKNRVGIDREIADDARADERIKIDKAKIVERREADQRKLIFGNA